MSIKLFWSLFDDQERIHARILRPQEKRS
jgi:hypothetical protein